MSGPHLHRLNNTSVSIPSLLYERLETAYDPNVLGYDPTAVRQPDATDTFMETAGSTSHQPHTYSASASSPSNPTPSTSKFIPSVLQPPPKEVVAEFKPRSSTVSSNSYNRNAPANSARDYSSSESDDEDLDEEEEEDDDERAEGEVKDTRIDGPDAMEVDQRPRVSRRQQSLRRTREPSRSRADIERGNHSEALLNDDRQTHCAV